MSTLDNPALDRRTLLATAIGLGLLSATRSEASPPSLRSVARDAWIFALPLIEMANLRSSTGYQANRLYHDRTLHSPASRRVTTPNNDTLYSSAVLDLSKGPVTLKIPDAGSRYLSIQILDMYTNTAACLSKRTARRWIESGTGTFTLVGPHHKVTGRHCIQVATPCAWVIARTLVDGAADLPAANAVQDSIVLSGPANAGWPRLAPRTAPALDYFQSAARLLAANPPPAHDAPVMHRIARSGLLALSQRPATALDAQTLFEIEQGVRDAQTAIRESAKARTYIDGWYYPKRDIGNFGTDYFYRALVALIGLGANTPDEAMYLHPRGDNGRSFSGDTPLMLHLPAELPVDGFWSLTMYEVTPEQQLFLTENPLGRYSIGDRTPGLRPNPDGTLSIWIGRRDPGGAKTANWLPAPRTGPFSLSLRAYWPRPELLDGRYRLPPLVPAA